MASAPAFASVESDGYVHESNTLSEEGMREVLGAPAAAETSEAARKLGEKGGRAAAEARKAKAKDEPKPVTDADAEEPKPEQKAKEAEPDEKAEDKPEKDKKGNPRHDPNARKAKIQDEINELTAAKRKEAAEVERLRQEREALARDAKPAPKPAARPADEDPEPDAADEAKYPEGRFDPKYLKDVVAHGVRQGVKAERQRQQVEAHEARQRHEFETKATRFSERMGKAMEAPEFAERLQAIPDDPVKSKVLVEILSAEPYEQIPAGEPRGPMNLINSWLFDSPVAPQVTLFLAEHPEEFQKLVSLAPRDLERRMARIEAKFDQEEQPKPAAATPAQRKAPDVSLAARPLTPVKATPLISEAMPDPNDPENYDAHAAYMNARERAAAGRRH